MTDRRNERARGANLRTPTAAQDSGPLQSTAVERPDPGIVCHDLVGKDDLIDVTFERFVDLHGRGLRAALVAAFGIETGADACSEALAYGWQHWARVSVMDNPAGYLFRVGQNAGRRLMRRAPLFPSPPPDDVPGFEPGLLPALAELSESQRVAVVLVHGYGWSMVEVAAFLDVSHSTVRTHIARGLATLRQALEVAVHVD